MPNECGSHGTGDDYPVYCVSWNDTRGGTTGSFCTATSFVGKLNVLQGTTRFRLPTEAEWERGARGGTTTEFSFAAPADHRCATQTARRPALRRLLFPLASRQPAVQSPPA